MIRREQSKDILNHVKKISRNRPIIITGDFNAEPNEPAYTTMIQSESLRWVKIIFTHFLSNLICSDTQTHTSG